MVICIVLDYCRLALTLILMLLLFGTPNAQRHAHIFVPRNGRFLSSNNILGKLTQRSKFLVVSNYMHVYVNNEYGWQTSSYYAKSIYKRNRNYSINNVHSLGVSKCCQDIRISSNGIANEVQLSSIGDYHLYGNDPDGARIYHNPKYNRFITRNRVLGDWHVR